MKKEKHCAKYVQSKTSFCKTKCVKLNFYRFVNFLLFWLLSILWFYHFHCFPISFLLLYLSFHLDSLHHHPDFPHFLQFHTDSRPKFQENSYFSSKMNTPLCYYCITSVQNHCLHHLRRHQWYHKNKSLTWLKPIIFKVWANNYEWIKYYLRFMSKRSRACPKLRIFS